MNENEINDLPRAVREIFRSIPNSTFDDDEELIDLREKLAVVDAEHQLRALQAREVRERIDQLKSEQGAANAEVSRLSAARSEILARAMLAGDDLAEGDQILNAIEIHRRRAEDIALAEPALQKIHKDLFRRMDPTSRQQETLLEKIKNRLNDLRLELAESRALG